MATVRVLSNRVRESAEPCDEEVFVSLENTPIVLSDIRTALPKLRKELAARWPVIRVEIENRRPTRRRNPYDPKQAIETVLGIRVVFLLTRTAQVFLDEVARAAGSEIGEYVRGWIQRVANAWSLKKKIPMLLGSRRNTSAARKGLPVRRKRH